MNKMKLFNTLLALFLLAATATIAGEANKQQRNLPDKPDKPRFAAQTDRDWPTKFGEASICLWKDDAFAAFTLGIDDNCSVNVPWWLEMHEKYGIRPTWFIVTVGVDGGKGMSGTWELWRKVHAMGLGVQSHSVTHGANWKGADAEYAESQAAIQKNIPGDKCLTIAYPGSPGCLNDPAVAMKYYIAARGAFPVQNAANQINYNSVCATSSAIVLDAPQPWIGTIKKILDRTLPKNPLLRGWYVGFYHFVKPEPAVYKASEDKFAVIQEKMKSNELWMGLFDEVAQYGQERDTTKLEVKQASSEKITLNLTDEMDDNLFDFPLTVKVRVDANWKSAKAIQGTKSVGCQLVEHNGAKYALIQVVPDRGPVALTPQ